MGEGLGSLSSTTKNKYIKNSFKNFLVEFGEYTPNSNTGGAEAGGSWVWSQLGLYNETLSQEKQNNNKKNSHNLELKYSGHTQNRA